MDLGGLPRREGSPEGVNFAILGKEINWLREGGLVCR